MALAHQAVAIDDGGHHSISLDQRECSFENPTELAGSRIVRYVSSGVDDVQFDKARDQGYAVGETANGDKYFLRYEGTAALRDGIPLHLEGAWRFTGGTGRLLGLSATAHTPPSQLPAAEWCSSWKAAIKLGVNRSLPPSRFQILLLAARLDRTGL
jgi:hypothetical protein